MAAISTSSNPMSERSPGNRNPAQHGAIALNAMASLGEDRRNPARFASSLRIISRSAGGIEGAAKRHRVCRARAD
jgi:hypothetical protein